jgi:hypothetical protein
MKKQVKNFISIALGSSLVLLLTLLSSNSNSNTKEDFWQYKKWTKVNQTPTRMADFVAIQCAAPNLKITSTANPHIDKFITVYVNDIGKAAMFSQNPKFPVGSIIVKEKLPTPTANPELMTVMIKQQSGFNPESGDWEYLVLDPVKSSIVERGKLERCNSCHLEKKDSDFIFRTYYYLNKTHS